MPALMTKEQKLARIIVGLIRYLGITDEVKKILNK